MTFYREPVDVNASLLKNRNHGDTIVVFLLRNQIVQVTSQAEAATRHLVGGFCFMREKTNNKKRNLTHLFDSGECQRDDAGSGNPRSEPFVSEDQKIEELAAMLVKAYLRYKQYEHTK